MFASNPEAAVHQVWRCEWSGSRLPKEAYLIHLIEEKKLKL